MGDKNLWEMIIVTFSFGSFTSLANQLRQNKKVPLNVFIGTCLLSGLTSVAIALAWKSKYPTTDSGFIFFISILAGAGGISLLDLFLVFVMKKGFKIQVSGIEDKEDGQT